MLREIICDKFKQDKIEFHPGLNVVLGDEQGSNSIGKSTFLMIIDFVYGGNDYIKKSIDIQKNVGIHTIKFFFEFSGGKYYFSRNTKDVDVVNICDSNYNVQDQILIDRYRDKLRKLYKFDKANITFRDAVGRYSRVYGKENVDEKRPLDVVHNEKAGNPINALLKLFDLFDSIRELEEFVKRKKDELKVFNTAQKYEFVARIGLRQREANDKKISQLEKEKSRITDKLNSELLDIDSEKTDALLKLKRELSLIRRKIKTQEARLKPLEDNLKGTKQITQADIDTIERFFPEADLRQIVEVEEFHKEIELALKQEIKEETTIIGNLLNLLHNAEKEIINKIEEVSDTKNLSQVILFKFAEIQKQIEVLKEQNRFFDIKIELERKIKIADAHRKEIKNKQISIVENKINNKMKELNDFIYDGKRVPPTLIIDNNQYIFETVDDTGTGTNYRGMILYDLSILQLTCLPIVIHDSLLLKQIEDVAIEKILEMYSKSEKQVFIALDKVPSYNYRSQEILNKNKVLKLGQNGNELFGKSWSKKQNQD